MAATKYKVKNIELIASGILVAALALTVILVQKQQNLQQEAAISCSQAYKLSFCKSFCRSPKQCMYQKTNSKGEKLYACCSISKPISPTVVPTRKVTVTPKYTTTTKRYRATTTTKYKATTTTTKQSRWYCSRCSDTYKYARAYWYEGDNVCDRSNVASQTYYYKDCTCTQGTSTSKGFSCP